MDNPYQTLNDLITDSLFPELDSRLRRGEHIDARHTHLFNMLRNGVNILGDHYHRYGVELTHAPEDFYYLRPSTGGKHLIRSRKLDALTMITGQVLALYHLDPEQLEGSGWISIDAIYERLRLLLDETYLCKLLERRKLDTQADREKGLEILRRSIRQLTRLGMVRLEGNQSHRVQTQSPLMRFIEPVRSAPCSAAALEKLVQQGYISLDDDEDIQMPADIKAETTTSPASAEPPSQSKKKSQKELAEV
ncbi:hypothetical protein ACH42_16885 [Endozoicomonas sp. (ex Bugula neritina AB1)]|nr:hypothetical protein ACH42_16885 [Endozoicomonas sp. (ex Bugula neritina AB1)]